MTASATTRWSSPVRYAEVDQQGVVFNAHYLLWCDEAISAFCAERGIVAFAEQAHVVASTLTWTSPARWGDVVDVDARCLRVGRTSATLGFAVTVGARTCCTVESVYVLVDADGTPQPIDDTVRAALQPSEPG